VREGHADVIGSRRSGAILNAGWEVLFEDKAIADITLADIAAGSGVTMQTVLRRFGDKDAVFAAMFDKLATDAVGRRGRAHSTRSTRSSLTWSRMDLRLIFDLRIWEMLRIDSGLSRIVTEIALSQMIHPNKKR